ncbi:MAG TPA: hypothetical protein VHA78_04715 [Candidatus Peribacteraceae bacterium]|nr:hypothetical protein [Candidatus Peribacteraceae bacterium]
MVNGEHQPSRDIDFPGRHKGEEFQFYFRQHWIRLWWPARRLLIWTIVFGIGIFVTSRSFEGADLDFVRRASLIALSVFFLLTQLSFLVQLYTYFLYVIIVTDKKIHRIKKTMLTVDDHQSIDLWTLEDISKNQHGIIQNMLGFGTLVLVMPTQDALRIHFTPFINEKHGIIMRLREQARQRMMPQQMVQQMAQQQQAAEQPRTTTDL